MTIHTLWGIIATKDLSESGGFLYNEKIKEAYIATLPTGSQPRIRRRFESTAVAECDAGRDIVEFTHEALVRWFAKSDWVAVDAVRGCIADFIRYNRWAHDTNQGFQFTDAVEKFNAQKDIEFTRGISISLLSSPDELVSKVSRVYPIDEGYEVLPALIFAWLGFTAGEAVQIQSEAVDCVQHRVFMPDGTLYPYPIPDCFWEPLAIYSKTKVSERATNSIRKVFADDLGFFLKKMVTQNSKQAGKPFTSDAISASVTRFSLLYEERFHEYIGFTYQTIMQSGRYYRLYQAELSGVDLYAKENKDLVMELGKGKMVKDVLTIYEAYRKAFYPR